MFCPICGTDSQAANSYCKRCGEWLPDIKSRTRRGFGGDTPEQNIFTSLFFSALSTMAALFSAIALYITYLGTGDGKWSVYFAAGFYLCIAGWQTSNFIVGLKLRQRFKRGRADTSPVLGIEAERREVSLNPADTSQFIGAQSVTENTTELLEPVLRTAKQKDMG